MAVQRRVYLGMPPIVASDAMARVLDNAPPKPQWPCSLPAKRVVQGDHRARHPPDVAPVLPAVGGYQLRRIA